MVDKPNEYVILASKTGVRRDDHDIQREIEHDISRWVGLVSENWRHGKNNEIPARA